MILTLLKSLVWSSLILFVVGLMYMLYWFVWIPLKQRKYFSRWPQIYMAPKFVPLMGDFKEISAEYFEKGKFMGMYCRDRVIGDPLKTYSFFQAGMNNIFSFNDPATFSEFISLVPTHIDRQAIDNSGFGRIGGTGGVSQCKTNNNWKIRRGSFLKNIGINYASRFIPIMVD
jgi:hypothetical protein